jgi:hypothetical protein
MAGGALFNGTGALSLAAPDGVGAAGSGSLLATALELGLGLALAGVPSDARDEEAVWAVDSLGALGPGRIPARRGQITPTAKPTAAMTPTLTQLGRPSPSGGI